MRAVPALVLALCVTSLFAQSDNQLLGQWACATRETVKVSTGRIIGDSAGENTLEFHDDQTALVTVAAKSGKTILRANGRWYRDPKKLTLQVEGEPGFTGSIDKAGTLVLRGGIMDPDRTVLHSIEWRCVKRP